MDELNAPATNDANGWLALAAARGEAGDAAGRLAAIDQALALEPRNPRALMSKADHFADTGDPRSAVTFYAAVLRMGALAESADLARAKELVERYASAFSAHVQERLQQHGLSGGRAPARFTRSIDILLGKRRSYPQAPRYFFYPELAPAQFFERAAFPFLDQVEAAFADIREELARVLAEAKGFEPYVKQDPKRPPNSQLGLAGNPAWSAFFLVKEGVATPGAGQCPKTLAALKDAPLARIDGRAPSILFSRLAPGARIPPHNGMINTRLICHLPLIVPPNCGLRVGNEVRFWEEARAWVFDDTIEHEAWNGSNAERTVLIFDIWRPDIDEDERRAINVLCQAIDSFGAGGGEWDA